MSFLIDSDVISEPTRLSPNAAVLAWLEQNKTDVYTSSHVIGELQAGIDGLSEGPKKRKLEAWFKRLLLAMEGRILNFNLSVAIVWGKQEAEFHKKGCLMPARDSFIAATARRHNLAIVTRNVADFNRPGLKVLNPYSA